MLLRIEICVWGKEEAGLEKQIMPVLSVLLVMCGAVSSGATVFVLVQEDFFKSVCICLGSVRALISRS